MTIPDTIPAWLDGHADELSAEQVGELVRQRAWFTDRGMPAAEVDTMTEGMVADVRHHTALQQQHADVPAPWWATGAETEGWGRYADGTVRRSWLMSETETETEAHHDDRGGQVHVEVIGEQTHDGHGVRVELFVDTVAGGAGILSPAAAREVAAALTEAADHVESLARQDDNSRDVLSAP